MTREDALKWKDRVRYNCLNGLEKEAVDIAFDALKTVTICHGLNSAGWISVEERLPVIEDSEPWGELVEDKGYRFLVADDEGYVFTENFWIKANRFGDPTVTHWMPLPEPPKEEV